MAMRLHISLDEQVVHALDARVVRRERSAFIAAAGVRALDDERRWEEIELAVSSLADSEHDWDADPAGWVQLQRTADGGRVG